MYPSSNNDICKPPRTSLFDTYYHNNDTNNSKTTPDHYHALSSSSSFLLPSPTYIPFEDEAVFCEFFQQQQFVSNDNHNHHNNIILGHEMTTNMGECTNNGNVATKDGDYDQCDFGTHLEPESSIRRKGPWKRGRHSKINTARGPRDRRMRLSLDVAKKLFGLQDLLGFDKASKTVDWLLTKSKSAILDLLPDRTCSFIDVSNSASSASECEVLSGTGDQCMVIKNNDDRETTKNTAKSSSGNTKKPKEKNTKGVRRCADYHHPLAKATRERARARARERTVEKQNNCKNDGGQNSKFQPCLGQAIDQDVNQLGSWSSLKESSNFRYKQGFIGDNSSLMMTAICNPTYFNYQLNSGLTQENQFIDFQRNGKTWEGYTS